MPLTRDMREVVGFSRRKRLQIRVYEAAVSWDLDVVELHDCFRPNELLSYEALGPSCGWVQRNLWTTATTPGGKVVTNPWVAC
jgi:hypothetical protein